MTSQSRDTPAQPSRPDAPEPGDPGQTGRETFSAASAVELARIRRSGFVETRHLGAAVVTGPDGQRLLSLGDPDALIMPRSTLKPFQTMASMNSGAMLGLGQIAIASGSHRAHDDQVEAVRSILAEAGVEDSALQCPAVGRHRDDEQDSSLFYNCSGKHAAFLAACVASEWDQDTYLDPEHPLQQEVLRVITELTGETPALVGTDGCGAPLPAISLAGLGRAYASLGAAARNIRAEARLATVATAMLDYPEFVEAPGRSNTVIMEELDVIAKLGAEGVLGLGTTGGYSVAVKMLDGSGRANALVGLNLLHAVGAVDAQRAAAVIDRVTPRITGGPAVVGRFEPSPEVSRLVRESGREPLLPWGPEDDDDAAGSASA